MKPSDNKEDSDIQNKDEFEQVVEKLKSSTNVLVTVSTDPSVDEFAACIGLTLVLNKVGRHANAVFSGKVPSTIDFLRPEETLEQNTDSLRDFIIALDKSKADKLRYKVENDVVKIFITPYKTSISEKDLEFSQGDLNVDVVVALGVQDKNHVDKAILNHGRILHDATVISINTARHSRLGAINWTDARASSLCEMVADIASELDSNIFDSQNATALLTGIVAETDRYSNDKAAPHTMSVAGLLMSAGASTQLVSSNLSDKSKTGFISGDNDKQAEKDGGDGLLEIEHADTEEENKSQPEPASAPDPEPETETEQQADDDVAPLPPPIEPISDQTEDTAAETPQKPEAEPDEPPAIISTQRVMHEPPEFSGKLTANSMPEDGQYTGSTDPFSNSSGIPQTPLLNREEDVDSPANDTLLPTKDDSSLARGNDLKINDLKIEDGQTLSEIEQSVSSPHLHDPTGAAGSTGSPGVNAGDGAPPESSTLDPNNSSPPPPSPPPYSPPEY